MENMKHAAQLTSSNGMSMKQFQNLLNCLMLHQYGWVFNIPVDIVELEIPDYFTVIKHPMDLATVKSQITSSQYSSPIDFVTDVRLTFSNAMIYNSPGNKKLVDAYMLEKQKVQEKAEPCELEENVGSSLTLDPSKGNHSNSETRKVSINMTGQVEQSSYSKVVTVSAKACLEGENASERQVSPKKLYRVALLINDFVSTIPKAHEKTFEKMEKIVDINKSCQLLKDLEILRVV
ncbi:transcription factor GTE11-like [Prosopis cineraria]|uniref:transcription factor GTE11-like n=1 Tax=Prosopis cineraria TaxID=364024 RepID=UPI00240F68E8|nr:transcription factor GTE11-like [Prosopis cineraria]